MSSHENTWERLINFLFSRFCCLVNSHFIFQLMLILRLFSFIWNFSVVVKVLCCTKGTSLYKKQHKREEERKKTFFHATSKEEEKFFLGLDEFRSVFFFSMIINVNSRYLLLIEWDKKWKVYHKSFSVRAFLFSQDHRKFA